MWALRIALGFRRRQVQEPVVTEVQFSPVTNASRSSVLLKIAEEPANRSVDQSIGGWFLLFNRICRDGAIHNSFVDNLAHTSLSSAYFFTHKPGSFTLLCQFGNDRLEAQNMGLAVVIMMRLESGAP